MENQEQTYEIWQVKPNIESMYETMVKIIEKIQSIDSKIISMDK